MGRQWRPRRPPHDSHSCEATDRGPETAGEPPIAQAMTPMHGMDVRKHSVRLERAVGPGLAARHEWESCAGPCPRTRSGGQGLGVAFGVGGGIVIRSPTWMTDGLVICGLAARSAGYSTPKNVATLRRLSPETIRYW